jgi:hypothetical protein
VTIFKVILRIDPEQYEKEFGVNIPDPQKFVDSIVATMMPQGIKSVTVSVEIEGDVPK